MEGSAADPNVIFAGAEDGATALLHIERSKPLSLSRAHTKAVETVGFCAT